MQTTEYQNNGDFFGDLKDYGPHRNINFNILFSVGRSTWKGFGSMALLKAICHWVCTFWGFKRLM